MSDTTKKPRGRPSKAKTIFANEVVVPQKVEEPVAPEVPAAAPEEVKETPVVIPIKLKKGRKKTEPAGRVLEIIDEEPKAPEPPAEEQKAQPEAKPEKPVKAPKEKKKMTKPTKAELYEMVKKMQTQPQPQPQPVQPKKAKKTKKRVETESEEESETETESDEEKHYNRINRRLQHIDRISSTLRQVQPRRPPSKYDHLSIF